MFIFFLPKYLDSLPLTAFLRMLWAVQTLPRSLISGSSVKEEKNWVLEHLFKMQMQPIIVFSRPDAKEMLTLKTYILGVEVGLWRQKSLSEIR